MKKKLTVSNKGVLGMRLCSIALGATVLTMVSCGSFLEEPVDNRTLITTVKEIKYTLASLTPRGDHLFTDLMTDDYTFRRIAGHLNQTATAQVLPIYTLQITKQSFARTAFLNGGFNPYAAWLRYYFRINNAWLMLKRIGEYKAADDEEQAELNSLKGECLAIKAYCNFMLVNLFAKAYDPATASADPAPPFVSGYSAASLEIFPQQTIAFFYDDIERSLTEALTLINDDLIDNNKQLHFTTIAVKAFLSKFYLYKKDYANCIKYATEVIGEKAKVVDVKGLIQQYIKSSTPKIADYSKTYFDSGVQESYLLVSDNTYQLISFFYSGMYPEPLQKFIEENGYYSDTFIRTSPLFGDIIPDKWDYFTSGSQRLQTMLPLFTVDETYYNRAEAYLQQSAPDLAAAKADLTILISADGYEDTQAKASQLANLNTQQETLAFLLASKRIRFFTEGIRWFDMKRYRLPVSHVADAQTWIIDGTNPQDYVIKPPIEEINFREYQE